MADRAELPVTVSPELPVDSSPAAELTAHLLDPLRRTPLCVSEQSTISYRAHTSSSARVLSGFSQFCKWEWKQLFEGT